MYLVLLCYLAYVLSCPTQDCEAARGNHDRPNDDSAFGSHNQLTGPFASSSSMAPDVRRGPREWEIDDRFDDGYGFSAQANVGRKGRENAKAKAREAQRLLEEADDEPDWFNQVASTGTGRGIPPSGSNQRVGLPSRPAPTTVELGFQRSSSSRTPWDPSSRPLPSRPSLRDRIDVGEVGSEASRRRDARDSRKARDTRRNSGETRTRETPRSNERKRAEDREKDVYGSPQDHNRERGSRWRGGYDR